MSYHNFRDKNGRFAPKTAANIFVKKAKKTVKAALKKPVKKQKAIFSFYLLDDTGSMYSKRMSVIEGFNRVLQESRKADKDNNIESFEKLALFGEQGCFALLEKVDILSKESYNPNRNRTAIYSNVIKAIRYLDQNIRKNDKVVLTIFTDGLNNDGWSYEPEAKILVEQRKNMGWVINFIGAGDEREVKESAKKLSIDVSNVLNYSNDSIGASIAMTQLSRSRGVYSSNVKKSIDTNVGFFAD